MQNTLSFAFDFFICMFVLDVQKIVSIISFVINFLVSFCTFYMSIVVLERFAFIYKRSHCDFFSVFSCVF